MVEGKYWRRSAELGRKWMSPRAERARVGVLAAQSEAENGREFTREAARIHREEREGARALHGGMWL